MTTTIDHLRSTETSQSPSPENPSSETSPENPGSTDRQGPTWADFQTLEQRLEQRTDRRDAWTIAIWLFAAIAVLFGVVAIGLGSRAVDEERNIRASSASATPSAAARTPAAPAPAGSPIAVTLSDMHVMAASTTIAAGQVTLQITNAGAMPHELLVFRSELAPADYPMKDGDINEDGPGITKVSDGENLDPSTSQTRVVDFTQPGTYVLMCNLPGHFKMGMFTVVTVK
jgi:uncharacterized cupredoxin-like copper-binding protein